MEIMLVKYGDEKSKYFDIVCEELSKYYELDLQKSIVELITQWHIKQHNIIVLFIEKNIPDKNELVAFLKHAKKQLPVKTVIVSDVEGSEDLDANLYLPWDTKVEFICRNIEELLTIQKLPNYYKIKDNIFINAEGNEFKLTEMQCRILEVLISNKNQTMTREEILELCGRDSVGLNTRNIDIHIKNIREKTKISNITSIRGKGYKWID